jgi:hypothetical protein
MSGLAALDAKCSSRLGLITVSYYLWTTFVAVVVGIVMVSIIHPGGAAQKEDSEEGSKPIMSSADALLDLIRSEKLRVPLPNLSLPHRSIYPSIHAPILGGCSLNRPNSLLRELLVMGCQVICSSMY